ncbi:hypothetical protein PBRA_008507 [Plasmodiophora brassicae]|uniref:SP-RING-type domain-containing protein n=1 Tax=Plasmodiophora brassicae TaxID=37360 RepID=A0A0G4J0W5_PLABS|nr:hypothetical protein PBRA_008507 [Plasmodiophora brassicae]
MASFDTSVLVDALDTQGVHLSQRSFSDLLHHIDEVAVTAERLEAGADAVDQLRQAYADVFAVQQHCTTRMGALDRLKAAERDTALDCFDEYVWNVHHSGERRVRTRRGDHDDDDDDDDVIAGDITYTKCPFTQGPLTNPFKSRLCGHVVSERGLQMMFGGRAAAVKCPVSGCRKHVTRSDFAKDLLTELAVRRQQRAASQASNALDLS